MATLPAPGPASDDQPPEPFTGEQPVIEQLERAGRDARWHMSRHTLELAMNAIAPPADQETRPKGGGKGRRRRRRKRLL